MLRSRTHAWWSAIVTTLAASAVVVTSPTTAAADDADESCALRPNPHISQRHEWRSCLSVTATLGALPAVGDTTTLTVEVTAQFARTDVRIEADLPASFEWARPPAGMPAGAVRSAVPADRGGALRAAGTASFDAGQTRRFEGAVRAISAGPADIEVRAVSPADGNAAPTDHLYLTVAERGGTSTPGMAGGAHGRAVPAGPIGPRATPRRKHNPATAAPMPAAKAGPESASLAADACVGGTWGYTDKTATYVGAPNYAVQAWDVDVNGPDEFLGVVAAGAGGVYEVCFDNTDVDGASSAGGQDVYLRFVSENTQWRVQETGTGNVFHYDSNVLPDVPTGLTTPVGPLEPGDPLHQRGVQAFDEINDLWDWIGKPCWDDFDLVCGQIVVNWRWDSIKGTSYVPADRQIYLLAEDPDVPDLLVHEAAHAVMDDVYEFVPVPTGGIGHEVNKKSSAGMAWVEGFAEWVQVSVYDDPNMDFPPGFGNPINLETPRWGTAGWENGDTVEGRVAGALIDLSDPTNESPWDRLAEGEPGNIWTTFQKHKSDTFAQFWTQRTTLDGFNGQPTGGLASLYQNTIDYTFRDPLSHNTPVSRPTPFDPHNFSYNTTTQFWSVVAMRPPAAANYDLRLFDNKAQTIQLGNSNTPGAAVEFVAVNSNPGMQALGDFYPKVTKISGSGSCSVDLVQGLQTLPPATSESITMSGAKVVVVRDLTVAAANVPATVKVTPGNATQDAELFIVSPVAGAGDQPNIRTRVSVTNKSSTAGGPGAVELITFMPPVAGDYGVVLINKAGSGAYILQRL